LLDTSNQTYQVSLPDRAAPASFQVLGVLGFTSDRKRMSVVIKDVQTEQVRLGREAAG
jgi:magnesium-transporting ATPase (P-type)